MQNFRKALISLFFEEICKLFKFQFSAIYVRNLSKNKMIPSVSIWPDNPSLAADSNIPFVIGLNCFDLDNQLSEIPYQKLGVCSKCNTPITKIFDKEGKILVCPMCKNQFMNNTNNSLDQILYTSFYMKKSCGNDYHYYVIFLLDVRGTKEQFDASLRCAYTALKSLPKEKMFIFCILRKNSVSFLKALHGKVYFIDLLLKNNMFNHFSVDFILNDQKEWELIYKAAESSFDIETNPIQDPIDVHEFFNPPKNCYIKIVIFSFTTIITKVPTHISIDIINHSKQKGTADGFLLYDSNPDFDLQITTLIERIFLYPVYLDTRIDIFFLPTINVQPSMIKCKSVVPNKIFTTTINYPWFSFTLESFPLEIMARALVFNNNEFYFINKIFSEVYPTTHNYFPFLRSVNPSIVAYCCSKTLQTNVHNISEFYNSKVIQSLPGEVETDTFFELLPNLSWFLRYIKNSSNWITNQIIEENMISALFFPSVSFWASSNEKIEENASEFLFGHLPEFEPIIVIDTANEINIFIDCEIENESLLSNEIQMRKKKRFPVPIIKIHKRSEAKSYFPIKWDWFDFNF